MAKHDGSEDLGWTLTSVGSASGDPVAKETSRRRGGRRSDTKATADAGTIVPAWALQSPSVKVHDVVEAVPPAPSGRRAAPPDLVFDVPLGPNEEALAIIRHPSGAITFHPSTERVARAGRRGTAGGDAAGTARFRVPVRRFDAEESSGRRGILLKPLKVVLVKVVKAVGDTAVSFVLPKLARLWESRTWSSKGLSEGWFRVEPDGTAAGLRLTPGAPEPGQRSLILVHGTFSNAASAFGPLGGTNFFERLKARYGTRIYAFNHFTVSRTPQENAAAMLAGLPSARFQFDAVTHSRGGLVLRNLIERPAALGSGADRIELGRAVLVASPNDGTPLATPQRWENTVGWFANLMEFFPDNPFTTGAEFVSEAIVWIASHLTGDLPGLRAMDGVGDLIADLQSPPGPAAGAYSALVSNFHPEGPLWQRALDVGVDSFFASANDLVVPSEGGWRIDRDGSTFIPGNRIGCFGAGGNLARNGGTPVTHISFFGRQETTDFIVNALEGRPQNLPEIDPGAPLPDRRFLRRRGAAPAISTPTTEVAVTGPSIEAPPALSQSAVLTRGPIDDMDTFHIVIMDTADSESPDTTDSAAKPRRAKFARIFASYGGARVTTMMRLRAEGTEPRTRFGKIIDIHTRLLDYTNREKGTLPTDDQLITFGVDLFETLFQGDVRRLYDEARARERDRKLDLVLTSMIPWIAEKPWEFAYDSSRESFLATEEIHFVRNVLTAVPADAISPCVGPLRILVVSAQPVGFGRLSIDQELAVILRGFEPLIAAGLIQVDPLPRAKPADIHARLSTGVYTVVHFIGHGMFDDDEGEGYLLFEDEHGGPLRLGSRSAREIFCGRGVSLVFLNACQSGTGGRADFNKGVAQSLVAHGLPALVANQYSVLDSSATSFAQHFYWALAHGMSLGQAAREARIAVNYSLNGELIDWAIPVLYTRDHRMALCAKRDTVVPVASTVSRETRRRRRGESRLHQIAVWDIDNVFPSLAKTLDGLNGAQQTFGFELVDMSAPIDVWDVEEKAPDGNPYLWAEKLAHRLRGKAAELGVDVVACITRHWMRDNEWLNLYGWWPTDRDPRMIIFSCAGFGLDALAAEGPATDRAIANGLVAALAGFFGNLDTHTRPPKNCPLAFNEDRDLAHVTGVQRFDAACRARLEQTLPKELPALDALLQVFSPATEPGSPATGDAGSAATVARTSRKTSQKASKKATKKATRKAVEKAARSVAKRATKSAPKATGAREPAAPRRGARRSGGMSLMIAGEIIEAAIPGGPHDIDSTLENAGLISAPLRTVFRGDVVNGVAARGMTISPAAVPNAASTTLRAVRTAVRNNAV